MKIDIHFALNRRIHKKGNTTMRRLLSLMLVLVLLFSVLPARSEDGAYQSAMDMLADYLSGDGETGIETVVSAFNALGAQGYSMELWMYAMALQSVETGAYDVAA